MDTETIEIDPEELSEDVREDLEEEIGDDIAEKKAKEILLNGMNNGTPNKKSSIEIIRQKFSDLNNIGIEKEKKYMFGKIKSIEPKNNQEIEFTIQRKDKDSDDSILLEKDSTELANLVEYKNVENVLQLEGEKIPYRDYGFHTNNKKYLIPGNLSFVSKTRFKIHNKIEKFNNIINILVDNDHFDNFLFGSIFLLAVSVFFLPITAIPSIIAGFTSLITISIIFLYITTDILLDVLEGDFYKIEDKSNRRRY